MRKTVTVAQYGNEFDMCFVKALQNNLTTAQEHVSLSGVKFGVPPQIFWHSFGVYFTFVVYFTAAVWTQHSKDVCYISFEWVNSLFINKRKQYHMFFRT